MKPRVLRLLAVGLLLAAAALPGQSAPTDGSGIPAIPGVDISQAEKDYAVALFNRINQERASRGLLELSEHQALWKAAFKYAHQLLPPGTPVSHISPIDGSDPPTRANREGYNVGTFAASCGENLAVNQPDALTCFNAWMASAEHQANIVRVWNRQTVPTPFRVHLAIGVAQEAGRTIVVGMFGLQQFLTEPSPTPTPRPQPQVTTLGIPANQGGSLAVNVAPLTRARTLTITASGSPAVQATTAQIPANQAKSLTIAIPRSTRARSVSARLTDGPPKAVLAFTPSASPTPTPKPTPPPRPQPQVASLGIGVNQAGVLTVQLGAFARARSLVVSVTGAPAVRATSVQVPANQERSLQIPVPRSTRPRTATARASDGPPKPVLGFTTSVARRR